MVDAFAATVRALTISHKTDNWREKYPDTPAIRLPSFVYGGMINDDPDTPRNKQLIKWGGRMNWILKGVDE